MYANRRLNKYINSSFSVQMEDDLNIYTDKGIASFGKLFGASVKGSIILDRMSISDNNAFPLKLSYNLSGRNYVGILEVLTYYSSDF
jgi:hypothetical protein